VTEEEPIGHGGIVLARRAPGPWWFALS
jgi:hypothetical protein